MLVRAGRFGWIDWQGGVYNGKPCHGGFEGARHLAEALGAEIVEIGGDPPGLETPTGRSAAWRKTFRPWTSSGYHSCYPDPEEIRVGNLHLVPVRDEDEVETGYWRVTGIDQMNGRAYIRI